MERGMRLWAKISSILFIMAIILYLSFFLSFSKFYNASQFIPWKFIIINVIIGFIIYLPLFYFGWFENTGNKVMKYWAKISTILFILSFLVGVIISGVEGLILNMISFVFALVIGFPLFYFAWR